MNSKRFVLNALLVVALFSAFGFLLLVRKPTSIWLRIVCSNVRR